MSLDIWRLLHKQAECCRLTDRGVRGYFVAAWCLFTFQALISYCCTSVSSIYFVVVDEITTRKLSDFASENDVVLRRLSAASSFVLQLSFE